MLLASEDKSILCSRFVNSWRLYVPLEEFSRMGVPNENWRLCFLNLGYEQISTYPEVIVDLICICTCTCTCIKC